LGSDPYGYWRQYGLLADS